MPRSITERVADWRDKKKKQGGKAITVMLEPEIAQTFDDLRQELGLSQAALFARAIKALEEQIREQGNPQGDLFSSPDVRETTQMDTSESMSKQDGLDEAVEEAFLVEIQKKLAAGARIVDLREDLKIIFCKMSEQGLSLRAIADAVNKAKLPSLSGKGKWGKSQIGRMVKGVTSKQ
jgi:hypothetical protein